MYVALFVLFGKGSHLPLVLYNLLMNVPDGSEQEIGILYILPDNVLYFS